MFAAGTGVRRADRQSGLRPVVVISGTGYDQLVAGRLVVVCPITSRDRGLAHHVPVTRAPTHRLDRPSWVMCEQPRTISSRRVDRSLGTLIPGDIDRVAIVVHRCCIGHEWPLLAVDAFPRDH